MHTPFLSVSDTNVNVPQVSLHVAGKEFMLTEREVTKLANEILWAQTKIREQRATYWKTLPQKYAHQAYKGQVT
jgi:predicted CoA-binding protein